MEVYEIIEKLWEKNNKTNPQAYITIPDIYEEMYGKGRQRKPKLEQGIRDKIQELKKAGIKLYNKERNGKGGFRLSEEYNAQNNPFCIFREGYSERRADFEKEFLKDMPLGWTSSTTKRRNYKSKKILLSDRITRLTQISILPDLLYAIKKERPIKLQYNSRYRDHHEVILHPAFLKEFSGRWYVCGIASDEEGNTVNKQGERTESEEKYQVYAIDRIEEFGLVENDSLAYIKSEENYWLGYFADLYGIWHNHTEPQVIVLETQNLTTYHRLRTKPIHHSQEEIQPLDENEKARFSIRVIPNRELTSLLMSYREKIKVISPENYKEKFIESLKLTLGVYGLDSSCE